MSHPEKSDRRAKAPEAQTWGSALLSRTTIRPAVPADDRRPPELDLAADRPEQRTPKYLLAAAAALRRIGREEYAPGWEQYCACTWVGGDPAAWERTADPLALGPHPTSMALLAVGFTGLVSLGGPADPRGGRGDINSREVAAVVAPVEYQGDGFWGLAHRVFCRELTGHRQLGGGRLPAFGEPPLAAWAHGALALAFQLAAVLRQGGPDRFPTLCGPQAAVSPRPAVVVDRELAADGRPRQEVIPVDQLSDDDAVFGTDPARIVFDATGLPGFADVRRPGHAQAVPTLPPWFVLPCNVRSVNYRVGDVHCHYAVV